MKPTKHAELIKSMEDMVRLQMERIATQRKMIKAILLAELLDIEPRDVDAPMHIWAEVTFRFDPGRPRGKLFVRYKDNITEVPLSDVHPAVWPETAHDHHGRKVPLSKPADYSL